MYLHDVDSNPCSLYTFSFLRLNYHPIIPRYTCFVGTPHFLKWCAQLLGVRNCSRANYSQHHLYTIHSHFHEGNKHKKHISLEEMSRKLLFTKISKLLLKILKMVQNDLRSIYFELYMTELKNSLR